MMNELGITIMLKNLLSPLPVHLYAKNFLHSTSTLRTNRYTHVFTLDTLLGDYINVLNRAARHKSDQRITYSLGSAERVGICLGTEKLRARGIATVTIPRIIQGAIWTFPSKISIQKLRTTIFNALWSTHRSKRNTTFDSVWPHTYWSMGSNHYQMHYDSKTCTSQAYRMAHLLVSKHSLRHG